MRVVRTAGVPCTVLCVCYVFVSLCVCYILGDVCTRTHRDVMAVLSI